MQLTGRYPRCTPRAQQYRIAANTAPPSGDKVLQPMFEEAPLFAQGLHATIQTAFASKVQPCRSNFDRQGSLQEEDCASHQQHINPFFSELKTRGSHERSLATTWITEHLHRSRGVEKCLAVCSFVAWAASALAGKNSSKHKSTQEPKIVTERSFPDFDLESGRIT